VDLPGGDDRPDIPRSQRLKGIQDLVAFFHGLQIVQHNDRPSAQQPVPDGSDCILSGEGRQSHLTAKAIIEGGGVIKPLGYMDEILREGIDMPALGAVPQDQINGLFLMQTADYFCGQGAFSHTAFTADDKDPWSTGIFQMPKNPL